MSGTTTVLLALLFVLGLVWAVVAAMQAPGPARLIVLVRRYGIAPFAVGGLGLVAVSVWYLMPQHRPSVVGSVALAVAGSAWWLWRIGGPRLALRRIVLRARWTSVVRSAGLANRDRRGSGFPGDATIVISDQAVEWTPTLSRPRTLGRAGVVYRCSPARGGTLDQLSRAADALAAGLRVGRIEVVRHAPHRGSLIVLWGDS